MQAKHASSVSSSKGVVVDVVLVVLLVGITCLLCPFFTPGLFGLPPALLDTVASRTATHS